MAMPAVRKYRGGLILYPSPGSEDSDNPPITLGKGVLDCATRLRSAPVPRRFRISLSLSFYVWGQRSQRFFPFPHSSHLQRTFAPVGSHPPHAPKRRRGGRTPRRIA